MAHSASFRGVSFKLSRALLVGIASSSLLLGCDGDVRKADKSVTAQLEDASTKINGSEAERNAAHQELDAASRDTTASVPVRLQAKSMLADSELRTAQDLTAKIQTNDVLIDQLVREIGLLGSEIDANNQRAAALAKYDPKAVQDAIAQKQADVKGSDDKPDWYKNGDTAIPSLAADDKQAAALQTQISQLQDTIKTEGDQRNQLLDQADKLSQQSSHEQKDKSVDLFVQSADLRKQAADVTVKMDQDNVTLTRAQADLAVRQGQHESLNSALKNFDDKSAFFAQDWAAVQKEIAALNLKSKDIIGEDPLTPPKKDAKSGDLMTEPTIGSKASAIVELTKANHDLRGLAETHFNSAISFYKESVDLAQKLQQELTDKMSKNPDPQTNPDAQACKDLGAAMNQTGYRMMQADAELQKAEFFAESASEDKVRLDLMDRIKTIATAAQATLPPTLEDDGVLASNLKTAQQSARDAFASSTDLLDKIAEGIGTSDQRGPAKVQLIFAHYAWAALENSAGDTQKAADQMASARTAVGEAVADQATIPALPPELAEGKSTTPAR